MGTRDLDNAGFAASFRQRKRARALLKAGYEQCSRCSDPGARRYITTMDQARAALDRPYVCVVCENKEEAERQRQAKLDIEKKARRAKELAALERARERARKEGTPSEKLNQELAKKKLGGLVAQGTRVQLCDWGAIAIWNMIEMKTMCVSKHAKMQPNGRFFEQRRHSVSFQGSEDAISWLDQAMLGSQTGKVRKDAHRLYWIDGEPRPRPFAGISGVAAGQADLIGMTWHRSHRRGGDSRCAMYHPQIHQDSVDTSSGFDFIDLFVSLPDSFIEFVGGKFAVETIQLTSISGGPMQGVSVQKGANSERAAINELIVKRKNLSEREMGGPLVAEGIVQDGMLTGKRFRFALF